MNDDLLKELLNEANNIETQKIICVIDVQNDFIDGALRNEEAIKVVPNIVKYLEENVGKAKIIYTKDTHDSGYLNTQEGEKLPVPHCVVGTLGQDLNYDVEKAIRKYGIENIEAIVKFSFGADWENWEEAIDMLFDNTPSRLASNLEFEFVGFCTDICVISNILMVKAMYPEAKVSCLSSLCAGVTPEKHAAALEVMRSCQIEVK